MSPPRLGTSCHAGMSPTTRAVVALVILIGALVAAVIFGA